MYNACACIPRSRIKDTARAINPMLHTLAFIAQRLCSTHFQLAILTQINNVKVWLLVVYER